MEKDPWRYCYNSSRLNELVDLVMEWVAKQCEEASRRAPEATATKVSILVCSKGKRNIVDNMEEEKSCRFRVDPLVEK